MSNEPIQRFTMRYIYQSLLNIFNLEKGLFHTIYHLAVAPGKSLRNYLFHERDHFMKPFSFLIFSITLAVIALINFQFGSKEEVIQQFEIQNQELIEPKNSEENTPEESRDGQEAFTLYMDNVFEIYTKYLNVFFIVLIPIGSIFSHLFYKKDQFYYAEHMIVNSYIMGIQNILYILTLPFMFLMNQTWYVIVYVCFSFSYQIYAYAKTFSYRTFPAIVRGILSVTLSYLLFFILILMIFVAIYIYVDVILLKDTGN